MTPNSGNRFHTVAEAADILRLTPKHVWAMCKNGTIPATKPAGTWLIPVDEFDAWIAAGANQGLTA